MIQLGTEWSTEDPRKSIGSRDRIIVLAGIRVVTGTVETKDGYYVSIEHDEPDERKFVAEDEEWPGWMWARLPDRETIAKRGQ